jgi:GTP-binding protein of the ras superfamily involved in termination of M-phase
MHPEQVVNHGQELPQQHMVSEGHEMQHQHQEPQQEQHQHQHQHQQPLPPLPMHVAGDSQEAQKHMDQPMDVDDSMNTTITASTVGPLPDFQATNTNAYAQNNVAYSQNNNAYAQNNAYTQNNAYPQNNNGTPEPYRPSTSYSDTAYQYTTHNGSRFNTPSDADTPPRQAYYDGSKETHMGQSHSRPNSQMGRYPASEGGSRANSYQDQNQRSAQQQQQQQQQQPPQEAPNKNASVVIKVGMVGDAQIGKTSLMVKYVEGSWDEDYIQTLGTRKLQVCIGVFADKTRCQLHGEDHINPKHRNHLLHLGSRRSARVRQHVAARLQRCRRYTLHVRPDAKEHTKLHQRVVSTGTRLQQDCDTFLGWHKVRSLCKLPS